jgi:serine/threonine-protein kinase
MSETVVLPSSPVVGQFPGDVIAGKYRLERELGRGAMGTVWAAVHVTLSQRVAIKLISGDQSRSPEARLRFGVEAKAAARLRSRHVVQVYDDGETPDGTPYIVMEYLEGETLEQRIERQRDMGLPEAVRITSHVGRALARAHAQGVVHRDLKSGNIFLARTDDDELGWVAKVLDFGVAKVLTEVTGPSATKTGTIVGTPLFMSPEQIRGASQVDHRADLYSLGMVFYNMVTGSHAFDGPSYSDVLVAICTEALPDIRVAAPWLPPSLGSWFDKACARDREQRFQSADEMIEALQEASGPASRMSRPSSSEEISGPSGTLVGHVPPHAAATVMALDASAIPPSVDRKAQPVRPEGGTLRSGQTGPLSATRLARPKARLTDSLVLWGVTGVGLACGTMALVIVLGRTVPASAPHAARSEVTAPIPAAPPPPPAVERTATRPATAPAAVVERATAAPGASIPTTTPPAPPTPASSALRPTARLTSSATPPRAAAPQVVAPRAERPAPAPVGRSPGVPGAPDMGF